jgi:hypothetical protein
VSLNIGNLKQGAQEQPSLRRWTLDCEATGVLQLYEVRPSFLSYCHHDFLPRATEKCLALSQCSLNRFQYSLNLGKQGRDWAPTYFAGYHILDLNLIEAEFVSVGDHSYKKPFLVRVRKLVSKLRMFQTYPELFLRKTIFLLAFLESFLATL